MASHKVGGAPPTGNIALVFTDIQCSTRLWDTIPEAMHASIQLHNALLRELLVRHGGYEVKNEGDAFFATFVDCVSALRWCFDAQLELLSVAWPPELTKLEYGQPVKHEVTGEVIWCGLRVRMGIHMGSPHSEPDPVTGRMDYFGPVVNRSARVASLAFGGQVVCSEAVMKALRDNWAALVEHKPVPIEMGTFKLKGLEDSETITQVLPGALKRDFRQENSDDPWASFSADAHSSSRNVRTSSHRYNKSTSGLGGIGGGGGGSGGGGAGASGTTTSLSQRSGNASTMSEGSTAESEPERGLPMPQAGPQSVPWLVSSQEIVLVNKIGSGAGGDMFLGEWNGMRVAVKKMLHQSMDERLTETWKTELSILSNIRHPNTILFMGAVMEPARMWLLFEYMQMGSLQSVLLDKNVKLPWMVRYRFNRDICKAMVYLHTYNPPIIHRDLKSPNLLVDENMVVKVGDFGFARLEVDSVMTQCGTQCWLAPEVLLGDKYNSKVDVYSYAVVMWEIATRKEPYAGLGALHVAQAVIKGERLEVPKDMPPAYRDVMVRNWDADPEKRDDFKTIVPQIDAMIEREREKGGNSITSFAAGKRGFSSMSAALTSGSRQPKAKEGKGAPEKSGFCALL